MLKQTYVYPGSDIDRARNLLAALGSFWARTYTGIDQLVSYVNATATTLTQTHLNTLEAVAALSRYDVPIFHQENWLPIHIKKSQLNSTRTNIARFQSNGELFDGAKLVFDTATERDFFAFPLPDKFVGAAKIFNRILNPTVALDENVDFIVDEERGALIFSENPFDNPSLTRRSSLDEYGQVDEEILLWAFKAKLDYDYLFSQFAYAVGLRLKSSEGAKKLTNAIITGLINGGASTSTVEMFLSAITGVPICAEPTEVVEKILRDGNGLFIATDKSVYRFTEDVEVIVSEGQTIHAGQSLIRAFEIHEFNSGRTPDTLAALALDRGVLASCFYGDLVFENKLVPLKVKTDHPSGYTYVHFDLSGFPADVKKFFDELHARGIEAAEEYRNDCFDKPLLFPTRDALPQYGVLNTIYQATDTAKFYRWEVVSPATNETGEYVELTPDERKACGPDWLQFFTRSSFPTLGKATKLYLAADTGKFYKWAVLTPALPEIGKYVETRRTPRKSGTLAHLLDKRAQPDGEPSAKDLPATINPLKFLIENTLRNNAFCVTIRISALGQNRLGMYNIRHIRQLLPPQTLMFLVCQLDVSKTVVNAQNVEDTLRVFKAMNPIEDLVAEEYVNDRGATTKIISGTCQ